MAAVFDKTNVAAAIDQLRLEDSNLALARHWLSLWDGDTLPPRTSFNPVRLKPFLAGLLLFDVVPDTSVSVRLAGTGYRYVLDRDPTGSDWIQAAPPEHRETRLKVFSAVARGGILVAHRRVSMLNSDDFISEEILLPFAPGEDGTVRILARVNFAEDQFAKVKSIKQVQGDPIDYVLMPLQSKTA